MYGILFLEDIVDKGLVVNRIFDVEEYDWNGYIFLGEIVYVFRILIGYGEFLYFLVILNFLLFEKENIFCWIIDMLFFSIDYMIKDLELVLGIVLFWIKRVKLYVIIFYLYSILVCLIMLKLKWVFFYYGIIGCKKNLIEVIVLDMIGEFLKEVFFKFN